MWVPLDHPAARQDRFHPFSWKHDECQRWLENNSRLKAFHAGKGKTIHIEDKNTAPTNTIEVQKMDGDADVDGFVQSLTDKDLRTVFKGLIEGAGKGSSWMLDLSKRSEKQEIL